METGWAVKNLLPGRRLFTRGESIIAPVGFAILAVVLMVMTASVVWVFQAQRMSYRAARAAQVRAMGSLLAHTSEVMLRGGEVSALRSLVAEAAQAHDLDACRITLPDGRIVADADPRKIALQKLPARWSGTPGQSETTSVKNGVFTLTIPLSVAGRGAASLVLSTGLEYPWSRHWEMAAGLGAIGVVALGLVLLVYRHMRSRLRAVGAIGEALMSLERGSSEPAALMVSTSLGPEARAWNALLEELEELRRRSTADRAKQALSSRQQAKNELAGAWEALSQGIVLVDEKRRVKYLNGAAAVFLQARREEVLKADVEKFIHDQRVLEAVGAITSGASGRRVTVEVEHGEQAGGGVLRFSVRPVRRQDSAAAVIVIDDITQQRVAEEARNAFVAQATHELRTPLTNIRLYVETALEEGREDPQVHARCLNVINQETRRLERMVGDILSVAEIEAGSFKVKKDDVRFEELFAELQADYQAQAKDKGIALKFDLPPKLPVTHGDRDKIALALHNLIANALKYTPEGGSVTVNVEADGQRLSVEVVDTGIGIGEEDLAQIFEKFYRAKDRRVAETTGSGLGLALAREVIRLHGGDITVESELDKGSTFTLVLPIEEEVVKGGDPGTARGGGDRAEALRPAHRG